MRLHAGVTAPASGTGTRCRAFVGGFGLPAMRDLDFGRRFVDYAEALEWPADVVVEDLPCAPHLVLHRLQELRPTKVVLVGSVERGTGEAGSVRRYRADATQPDPADVHLSLAEGVGGVGDLRHTLRVLRHWGALPADTVIVEVEPADTSFGPGFSEEIGASIEPIVDVVRSELASVPWTGDDDLPTVEHAHEGAGPPTDSGARVIDLAHYAEVHDQVSDAVAAVRQSMLPDPPRLPGLVMAARSRPFGTGLHTKGDWYDFVPMPDGWLGIAIGDVAERGLEAAIVMSHLRSAIRAAGPACGPAPGQVVGRVDRVVADTGLGRASTLLYLVVNARTGEVRLANAGHCRPLVVGEDGSGTFVAGALSPRLGAGFRDPGARPEVTTSLGSRSTLLLYTDGLVSDDNLWDDPLGRLRAAATNGRGDVGDLCDQVMSACLGGVRRRDDASLLALRLED